MMLKVSEMWVHPERDALLHNRTAQPPGTPHLAGTYIQWLYDCLSQANFRATLVRCTLLCDLHLTAACRRQSGHLDVNLSIDALYLHSGSYREIARALFGVLGVDL